PPPQGLTALAARGYLKMNMTFIFSQQPDGDAGPAAAHAWPPPPHDPRERELVFLIGGPRAGWELRAFSGPQLDLLFSYCFGHVQLWHAAAGISILTPSRMTCGRYEAFPVEGRPRQADDYDELSALLGVTCPGRAALAFIERCFVARHERASSPAFRWA